jgi:copper-binding protein NosD
MKKIVALQIVCWLLFSGIGSVVLGGNPDANLPQLSWLPKPPSLAKPAGHTIRVSNVEELFQAAENVKPGETILLADSVYYMPRYFSITTDNVTLRGASGDRTKVILDGSRSRHGELIGITGCSGVTVADLTIQNVRHNGLKINSNLKAHQVTAYNCVFHNIWQRAVKGPFVPPGKENELNPRNCRIQYCLFYNDRPKQYSDDSADTPQNFRGNYVGGIDAMQCRGWTISDNVFFGIRGRTGEARGAVFLWQDSRDCIVERNVILNCDSGICLGNSHRSRFPIHAVNCIVRNNFIVGTEENGILADYTRDCKILHNTIHHPASRLRRLIRIVHDNPGLIVANNLLSGPDIRIETNDKFQNFGNRSQILTDAFQDVSQGNLHLNRKIPHIVDSAIPLPQVTSDFDRQSRDAKPDIGADEWTPKPPLIKMSK